MLARVQRILFIFISLVGSVWAQVSIEPSGDPVQVLDEVEVRTDELEDDFDVTGMGYLEAERRDPPFSNDLLYGESDEDELGGELDLELSQVAVTSAADLATGSDRVNLRGFPTPRLRNAFVQTGMPEVLGTARSDTIQGPLTPVTGRGAPGGIQNYMTARPPGKARTRLSVDAGTDEQVRAQFETGGPLTKWGKTKVFQRVALNYDRRDGPEEAPQWSGSGRLAA